MKLYSTWYHKGTKNLLFSCFFTYNEAIKHAKEIMKTCLLDSVDIVDMDTDKIFITLHSLKYAKIRGTT